MTLVQRLRRDIQERLYALQPRPTLPDDHTIRDFVLFQRAEMLQYSRHFVRRHVHLQADPAALPPTGGALIVFLHYGSFFLIGGAIRAHDPRPLSAIVTRRNLRLEMMNAQEIAFWHEVHAMATRLYGSRLLYSDEHPRTAIRWLREGHLLAAALDVREWGVNHRESPLHVGEYTLYMQTGPARLAQLAGVPMIPAIAYYDRRKRRHEITLGPSFAPGADPVAATRKAVDFCIQAVLKDPRQQFHDILAAFSQQGLLDTEALPPPATTPKVL